MASCGQCDTKLRHRGAAMRQSCASSPEPRVSSAVGTLHTSYLNDVQNIDVARRDNLDCLNDVGFIAYRDPLIRFWPDKALGRHIKLLVALLDQRAVNIRLLVAELRTNASVRLIGRSWLYGSGFRVVAAGSASSSQQHVRCPALGFSPLNHCQCALCVVGAH